MPHGPRAQDGYLPDRHLTSYLALRSLFIEPVDYCIRYGYSLPVPPTTALTPAVFHILLALSSGERHGYRIMKQVEVDSQGKVNMGAGTLYGSLKRMLDAGLVVEGEKRADPDMDDERRIYYRITRAGTKALAAELARYEHLVALARKQKLSPETLAYGV